MVFPVGYKYKSSNNHYSLIQRNKVVFGAEKPAENDSFNSNKAQKKTNKVLAFFKNTMITACVGLVGLGLVSAKDIKTKTKKENLEAFKTLFKNKKFVASFGILSLLGGYLTSIISDKDKGISDKDKGKIKLQNYFKELTESKGLNSELIFDSESLKQMKCEAAANFITGKVQMKPKYACPINSYFAKKLLKHEVKHLEQYTLVGMYDLEKLNLIIVKKWINILPKETKEEIMRENVMQNKGFNKKSNEIMDLMGYKIHYKDFSKAAYKILTNPDTSKEEIPILINKEFYQKAKEAHGPLSEKEKVKAQKYLEAIEKYPDLSNYSYFDFFNPFSNKKEKYKDNLLEREAYEAQKS